jgi:hypothetical protein
MEKSGKDVIPVEIVQFYAHFESLFRSDPEISKRELTSKRVSIPK